MGSKPRHKPGDNLTFWEVLITASGQLVTVRTLKLVLDQFGTLPDYRHILHIHDQNGQ